MIGEQEGTKAHLDFHLSGQPQSCGTILKLGPCIEHKRRHPCEWREGCKEVRPYPEDLVIAGTNPGHTLDKNRYGGFANAEAAHNRRGVNVLGEGHRLGGAAADLLPAQVSKVRPGLLQRPEEKLRRGKACRS